MRTRVGAHCFIALAVLARPRARASDFPALAHIARFVAGLFRNISFVIIYGWWQHILRICAFNGVFRVHKDAFIYREAVGEVEARRRFWRSVSKVTGYGGAVPFLVQSDLAVRFSLGKIMLLLLFLNYYLNNFSLKLPFSSTLCLTFCLPRQVVIQTASHV